MISMMALMSTRRPPLSVSLARACMPLQLLGLLRRGEPLHEAHIGGVPRLDRDEVPEGGASQQIEVSDEIKDLVADELVVEPERLLVQDPLRLDHNGVLQTPAQDHAARPQRVHVALEHERARRRDLLHEDFLVDVVRRVLRAEVGVVVFDGEGDAEPVVRQPDENDPVLS
jgi:hypothetical protein